MSTDQSAQGVSTEEARRLAAVLIVHAGDHKDVAYECDMNPVNTVNWSHHLTSLDASKALLTLVSERDALASRVMELSHLLQIWSGDGQLQTFENRERFRKAARAALTTTSGDSHG